jgi:predicted ATPase/transcriptional regulator with XRE-family HTH domain
MVRRRRKSLDLTQQKLADQVGCAVSTLVKIENEARRPSREMAERLADVLDVSPTERTAFLHAARRHGRTLSAPDLPPIRSSQPNLPLPATMLIGREGELAAMHDLLNRAECRLLTIVGPGGVGKTRLALQAAAEMRDQFADGVTFVSLAPLTSGDQLPSAIAAALGFSFSGAAEPRRQLLDYLRFKHMLLVFDNIEHLVSDEVTIELVTDLLAQAAQLQLVITSRERLNVQREWMFEVQGLAVPPDRMWQPDRLESYPAAALFLQHARRLQPTFALAAHDAAAIVRICRAVEGLPLAIELAAAWLPTLTCTDIAGELERSINILSSAARDVPERHRSMQAVFDRSWQLLSADEQRVLQALSVFHGTFTRAAAQAVADAKLHTLHTLISKSLLRRTAEGRFDLHDLIQQCAATKLRLDPAAEACFHERHAHYFLGMFHDRLPDLKCAKQQAVLHELDPEIDNVRAAWAWAVAHGAIEELQRATWAVWYFFDLRNLYREYVEMFMRAEAVVQREIAAQPDRIEAEITLHQMRVLRGFSGIRLGQIEDMRALLRESVFALQRRNAVTVLADALWVYGLLSWLCGDFETAVQTLLESLDLNRKLGQPWQIGLTLAALGAVHHDQGHYPEAYALLQDSVSVCQAVGVPRNTTFAVGLLARTAQALGHNEDSLPLLHQQLQLAIEMNDRSAVGFALEHLGLSLQAAGRVAEAGQHFQQAIAHYLDLGDLWSASRVLNYAGQLLLSQRQWPEARQTFGQALRTATEGNVQPNALDAVLGLAEVNGHSGDCEAALKLIGHVLQHAASAQAARDRADQLRVDLEAQLTPQQIADARREAQAKSFDVVVAEILARYAV